MFPDEICFTDQSDGELGPFDDSEFLFIYSFHGFMMTNWTLLKISVMLISGAEFPNRQTFLDETCYVRSV